MNNKIEFYKEKDKIRFERTVDNLGGYNSERALKIATTKINYYIHGLKIEKKLFKLIKKKINSFRKEFSLRCTVCYNAAERMGFEDLENFVNEYRQANKKELKEALERKHSFQNRINNFYDEEERYEQY